MLLHCNADRRLDNHRRKAVEDMRSRGPQAPLRLLRDWESWIDLTDNMILDAFNAVSYPLSTSIIANL